MASTQSMGFRKKKGEQIEHYQVPYILSNSFDIIKADGYISRGDDVSCVIECKACHHFDKKKRFKANQKPSL